MKKGEYIVACRAEKDAGPGWSNRLIWVVIKDREGNFREDAIQPEDQSEALNIIFNAFESLGNVVIYESSKILKLK